MKKLSVIFVFLMLVFCSCQKNELNDVSLIDSGEKKLDTITWEYRYQINGLQLPSEFTIIYLDSLSKLREIKKTHTDCSLFYSWKSTKEQSMFIQLESNQDVEIILWICKNDTVIASATGRQKTFIKIDYYR